MSSCQAESKIYLYLCRTGVWILMYTTTPTDLCIKWSLKLFDLKLKWLDNFHYISQMPNFMKICSAVFKLLLVYRQMKWQGSFSKLCLNKKWKASLNTKFQSNYTPRTEDPHHYHCFIFAPYSYILIQAYPAQDFRNMLTLSPLSVNENCWHVIKYYSENVGKKMFLDICWM
jgi:hypothetical protein